jgi:hypothetical protein
MIWQGNARPFPETMTDLSDEEWWKALIKKYGAEHVHIGEPQDGGYPFHDAKYWSERGMVGIYIDEEALFANTNTTRGD